MRGRRLQPGGGAQAGGGPGPSDARVAAPAGRHGRGERFGRAGGRGAEAYGDELCIAAINGPQSVVISGRRPALEALCASWQARGVRSQPLQVSHAFHSALMEPVLGPFSQLAGEVHFYAPRLDVVCNLHGRLAPEQIASAAYWCRHLREPVQFAAGMHTVRQLGVNCLVEIGPKPVLLGLGRQCLADAEELLWLPSLRPGQSEGRQMLESLAQLYGQGAVVDWRGLERERPRRRLVLPTYPFERRRCWCEPATRPARSQGPSAPTLSPVLQLLSQGQTGEVAQQLEGAALTAEQRQLLPQVLEAIVGRHRAQLATAGLADCFYRLSWASQVRRGPAAPQGPGRWLLVAEGADDKLAGRLAEVLERQGCLCRVLALSGSQIPAQLACGEPLGGIVLLGGGIGASGNGRLDLAGPQRGCERALELVKQLLARGPDPGPSPRLWVLTHGAVAPEPTAGAIEASGLAQAPLWGLGKVIGLEHPELWGGLLDVGSRPEPAMAEAIVAELLDSQGEDQLALRSGGRRFVARLEPCGSPATPGGPLGLAGRGHLPHYRGLGRAGAADCAVAGQPWGARPGAEQRPPSPAEPLPATSLGAVGGCRGQRASADGRRGRPDGDGPSLAGLRAAPARRHPRGTACRATSPWRGWMPRHCGPCCGPKWPAHGPSTSSLRKCRWIFLCAFRRSRRCGVRRAKPITRRPTTSWTPCVTTAASGVCRP